MVMLRLSFAECWLADRLRLGFVIRRGILNCRERTFHFWLDQGELWNFEDAEAHVDKDTSQQMLAIYQERLTSSAVRIDGAGDPANKADVAISMQARWCAKDLDCLAAAKILGSDILSPAEQKENDGQKQRCLESFTRDLAELKRMAK
jgi:citrate lyase beta subunit